MHRIITDCPGQGGTCWEKQKRRHARFLMKQDEAGLARTGWDGVCRTPSSTPNPNPLVKSRLSRQLRTHC